MREELDESDFKLIKLCKQENPSEQDFIDFWCDRCEISKQHFHLYYIIEQMIHILDKCGKINSFFMLKMYNRLDGSGRYSPLFPLHDACKWFYFCLDEISLLSVKDAVGYGEWRDKN